ncbi:MAG: hypothetical protein GC172_06185 [Phycisphaera sp.]|nr:hypothetical protein [Phycisphaera sp.]
MVLTARDGAVSRALRQTIDASGTRCEILGHPLLALAELLHLERAPRDPDAPRPTLVVADREIDDLAPLFAAVRSHLPQLAIWVFEGNLAIEIQRGQSDARPAQPDARPAQLDTRPAPMLRIAPGSPTEPSPSASSLAVEHRDAGSASTEEDPPGPSGNTVTPEELEMLLDLFDGDRSDGTVFDGRNPTDGRPFGGPTR